MNQKSINLIIATIFGIVLILNIFMALDYYKLNKKNHDYYITTQKVIAKYNVDLKEQCILYDAYDNISKKNIADGLYWSENDFYCVWTKNKEISEIEKTEKHEYCHSLVYNEYEHFCINPQVKDQFDIIENSDTK